MEKQFAVALMIFVGLFAAHPVLADDDDTEPSVAFMISEGLLDLNNGAKFHRAGLGVGAAFVRQYFEARITYRNYGNKRDVTSISDTGDTTVVLKKDRVHGYTFEAGLRAPLGPTPFYINFRPGFAVIHEVETQFDIIADIGLGGTIIAKNGEAAVDFDFLDFSFWPNRSDKVQNAPHVNFNFNILFRKFF